MEVRGQLVTIGTGGFRTSIGMIGSLLREPCQRFCKLFLIVGEHLMFQFFVDEKRHVKLAFGNLLLAILTPSTGSAIQPPFQREMLPVHALSDSTVRIQTLPSVGGFSIPYELHGQGFGKGISSTTYVQRQQVHLQFTLPGIP